MNLNPLPVHDRLRQSASTSDRGTTASAIKEFLLLEECVARCETLAAIIVDDADLRHVMEELSECIAACQTYLAAKSRESRYEGYLRVYCADALAHTAASCQSLRHPAARACHKMMRASLQLIGTRSDSAAPSCN